MRSPAFLLLALLSGFAVFVTGSAGAPAPDPKHLMKEAENTEQAKLQGKWKLEAIDLGNMRGPGEAIRGIEATFEIRTDKLTVTLQGQTVTATFKLDTVDGLTRLSTINAQKIGQDGKPLGKEADAVFGYIVDGDKLMLAARSAPGSPGNATIPVDPKKPGLDGIVMVLVRVKDKN